MCLYPRVINNRKYVKNKKNGGNIPPVLDARVLGVPVGCGNCIECRKQKARGWQVRLMEDIKENTDGKFITLTFNNEALKTIACDTVTKKDRRSGQEITKVIGELEGYERENEIAVRAIRLFLERWRKQYGKSLRHWLVTELGHKGTEHIHIHGIVWTDQKKLQTLKDIWGYGYVWDGKMEHGRKVNYVTERTVNYIVKYVSKVDMQHQKYKSKVLTSAGIGGNYVAAKKGEWIKNKFNEGKTVETYRTGTGHKIAIPMYWRNKIYSDEQREMLWVNRLDKQERWVRGEKVGVGEGEEAYYELLEWHRRINKELGYGTGEKGINEWNREVYERERRNAMWDVRMGKKKE